MEEGAWGDSASAQQVFMCHYGNYGAWDPLLTMGVNSSAQPGQGSHKTRTLHVALTMRTCGHQSPGLPAQLNLSFNVSDLDLFTCR
jgi:hypothetical protein